MTKDRVLFVIAESFWDQPYLWHEALISAPFVTSLLLFNLIITRAMS